MANPNLPPLFLIRFLPFCLLLCTAEAQEPVPTLPSPDFGLALLPPEGWETSSAKQWAAQLYLPVESETKYQSSYRAYCGPQTEILGANPKSVALLASEDHPEQLTLIFANKGDSASPIARSGNPSSHPSMDKQEITKMIHADATRLREKLTLLIGKPKKQLFGDFGKTRESADRWDQSGTALLLIEQPGEYTALRILASSLADSGGRPSRVEDSVLRERMKANVIHRPNGDIIITNIPMVDQGPKGFCVPATYARALIYAGVPADLYLLALLGNTGVGGGTSVFAMEKSARALAATYGRAIISVTPTLDLPKLESYFARGIPLTWALYVDEGINRDLSQRMKERPNADPQSWSKKLDPIRKAARSIRKNPDNGHVCLLIGCNRQTGELATSDSWGPEFNERWITVEEARALSQGDLGAIMP